MNTALLVVSVSSRVKSSKETQVALTCMPPQNVVSILAKTHRVVVFQDDDGRVFARRALTMLVEEDSIDDDSDSGGEWENVTRQPPRMPLAVAPKRNRLPRLPGFQVSHASVVEAPWDLGAVLWPVKEEPGWRVRCTDPMLFLRDPLFTTVLRPGDAFVTTPCDTRPGLGHHLDRRDGMIQPGENLTCVLVDDTSSAQIPILVADDNTKHPCRDAIGHTAFQLPLDTPPPVEKDTRVAVFRHGAPPTIKDLWAATSPTLGLMASLAATAKVFGQPDPVPDDEFLADYNRGTKEVWDASRRIFKPPAPKKKRRRRKDITSQWDYLHGHARNALFKAQRELEAEEDGCY